jgi:hypothetical protein
MRRFFVGNFEQEITSASRTPHIWSSSAGVGARLDRPITLMLGVAAGMTHLPLRSERSCSALYGWNATCTSHYPTIIPPYAYLFMTALRGVNSSHSPRLFPLVFDIIAHLRSFATRIWHSFLRSPGCVIVVQEAIACFPFVNCAAATP